MSLQKLGEFRNAKTGEIVGLAFGPPNASTSACVLSEAIYALSEIVIRGMMPKERFGGMGGDFGYACEFENDVFELHPDYQHCACPYSETESDEFFGPPQIHRDDCPFMAQKPNFRHKASGLEICWYKWIGREMSMNRESISGDEWDRIFRQCVDSLPAEVVAKAQAEATAEAERDTDPEYQKAREQYFDALLESLMKTPFGQ